MEVATRKCAELNVTTIYLATDDATTIDAAEKNYSQYKFIYMPLSRVIGVAKKMLSDEELQHKSNTFLNLLTELEMLRKSVYFIGTGGSNMSHLVVRLLYMYHGVTDLDEISKSLLHTGV